MYYISARFEEVKELELRQIGKKGVSMELLVYKGKNNQTRQLQRVVIHPNSMSHTGKTCPFALLDDYLSFSHSLGHDSENDYFFPVVGVKWARLKPSDPIKIRLPIEALSYNVYRKHLKRHLDCAALKEMGVFPDNYSTHSFRKGSLSMLVDGDMHPAFIQKAAQHKRADSSVTYIESYISKALNANDLLSGNNPSEGWGS